MKLSTTHLVTIIIFLFTISLACAQDNNLKFGVKGGANLSYLNIDRATNEEGRIGFHLGIVTEYPLNDKFSIQPELLYSTKGVETDYNLLLARGSAKLNLDYIEMPIVLKYNISDFFNAHFGPYLAYLAHSDISVNGDLFSTDIRINESNLDRWDYGLAIGGGLDLDTIEIGLRLTQGIQNINNNLVSNLALGDARNMTIQAYLIFGL